MGSSMFGDDDDDDASKPDDAGTAGGGDDDATATPADGGDGGDDDADSTADGGGGDDDGGCEGCFRDITLLNDPSGDNPNPVARGHADSADHSTMNNDTPVGAYMDRGIAVSPEQAKAEDGAEWAGEGVEPGSSVLDAITGAGSDAASAAALGASVCKGGGAGDSGVLGEALGAAIGAIF